MTPFSQRAREIMQLAEHNARRCQQNYVGTEHVLLALVDRDAATRDVLEARGVMVDALQMEVQRLVGTPAHPAELPQEALPLSPRLRRTLERGTRILQSHRGNALDTPYLLLALLADPHSAAGRTLVNLGVDVQDLHDELNHRLTAGLT